MSGYKWLGRKLEDGSFDNSVSPGSLAKTWWKCPAGHKWEATYHAASEVRGCLICRGSRVDYERLDDLIRQRLGSAEIMAVLGCSITPICVRRRALGIPVPGYYDQEELDRLIRASLGNREIAEKLGCSILVPWRRRRKLGIPDPRYAGRVEKRREATLLMKQGLSDQEIAGKIGWGRVAVNRLRREVGVRAPHRVDYERLDDLIRQRLGNAEIMAVLGCSITPIGVRRRALGIPVPDREWVAPEVVRAYVQEQGLTYQAYHKLSKEGKLPEGFPSSPDKKYSKLWSWFSGNNREWVAPEVVRDWIAPEVVRAYVQEQGLTYQAYVKLSKANRLPNRFPGRPDLAAKKPWSWFSGHGPGYRGRAKVETP